MTLNCVSSSAGFIANAGKRDEGIEWASWAQAHDEQNTDVKLNSRLGELSRGALRRGCQLHEGHRSVRTGHCDSGERSPRCLDEARAIVAEWRKKGPFSIATGSCWQVKEPMNSAYLESPAQSRAA